MFFNIFSNGDGRGKEWLAKNLLMEQKNPGENADIGKYWLNFYADNSTDFSVITGRQKDFIAVFEIFPNSPKRKVVSSSLAGGAI